MGDRIIAAGDVPAVEAFCAQVVRMRDAQARVDAEGLVVADAKGLPVPHPALALELAASTELRMWTARRPDLFASVKKESSVDDPDSWLDEMQSSVQHPAG